MSRSARPSVLRRLIVTASVALAAIIGAVLTPTAAFADDEDLLTVHLQDSSAAAISGIYVYLYGSDGWSVGDGHQTDASGDATFPVLPGDYTLYVETSGSPYLEQWWSGKPSKDEADYFTFTGSDTKTVTLETGAVIAGTVTDSAANPVVGAEVRVYPAESLYGFTGTTDSSGNYSVVGLPTGDYKVEVRAAGFVRAWWGGKQGLGAASTIAVTAPATTSGTNLTLVRGASATGTATYAGGAPGAGAQVRLLDKFGADIDWILGTTQPDGTFNVSGLPAGTFSLSIVYRQGESTWQGVTSQFTIAADGVQTGLQATLVHTWGPSTDFGQVHVTATSGGDEIEGDTWFYKPDGTAVYCPWEACWGEDRGLPVGTYKAKFIPSDPALATTWSGGASSFATASSISVTSGATTNVNIAVPVGGTISGRVTNASGGDGVGSVNIEAHRVDADADEDVRYTTADSEGYFSVPGLANGHWKLFAKDYAWGMASEWWQDAATKAAATSITISGGGTVSGRSIQLSTGAVVSGTVTFAGGSTPAAGGYVTVSSSNGYGNSGLIDETGHYTITGIGAGTYTLLAMTCPTYVCTSAWYGNTSNELQAQTFSVALGDTVTGKDIVLPSAPAATGKITDEEGDPIAGAFVVALKQRGSSYDKVAEAATNGLGNFSLPGLSSGQYKLAFTDYTTGNSFDGTGGLDFIDSFWQGKSSVAAGDSLSLSASTTHTGLNVTLESAEVLAISGRAPTISGTPTQGETLTAVPGTWGPSPVALSYRWLRDGASISGATSSTYLLTSSDLDKQISVRVTGTKSGYPTTVNTSSPVLVGRLIAAAPTPTISGVPAAGQTLTATVGTWTAGVVTSLQWNRDGEPIDTATGTSYLLTEADLGHVITVSVTGTKAGYTSVTKTSAETTAIGEALTSTPVPTVSGTPTVGETLTADAGTWAPDPVALAYQWKRNGSNISSATASTYALTSSDAGKTVTVTVTGTKSGYAPISMTSSGVLVGNALTTAEPSITGTPTVGQTLTIAKGSWGPSGVTTTYQWYRDGSPISGATASTYTPVAADAATTLSASVTGSLAGYTSATRTSSGIVIGLAFGAAPVPTVSGAPTVGETLTVDPGSWAPAEAELAYQWKRDGSVIDGETGTSYELVAADSGTTITVSVTGTLSGYTPVTRTSAGLLVGFLITATQPVISGEPSVGKTLKAIPGAWGPGTVALTYQWYRNGAAISGATASTRVVSTSDLGKQLTVKVAGTRPGYTAASSVSEPVTIGIAIGTAPTPTVSGTPTIGSTLTATVGTWSSGVALTTQWKRDGADIDGAIGTSYLLDADDVGHTVTVAVTGSKPGYTTAVRTSAGKLIGDALTLTPEPSILGTPTVGKTLTIDTGSWGPDPVALSYRWKRNGASISGATGSTYKLTSSDAGKTVTVTVTGTKAGFTAVSTTSDGLKIGKAFTSSPTPTISGTPTVGQKLTGRTGTWGPSPVTTTYQWLRNGSPIPGAIGKTYVLAVDDQGQDVTFSVTAKKSGYTTVVKTSAPRLVGWPLTVTPTPTISGTPTVGETLTADAGVWDPAPVALAYQWKRSGVAIPDAVGADYTLVASDAGKSITVSVTGSADGYTSVTKTSTGKTIGKAFTSSPVPVVNGAPALGVKLTATVGTWGPATVTLTYQWYRDGVIISGATSSSRTITVGDLGKTLTLRVTGSKSGYTRVTRESAPVVVPAPPTL